jgi:hypothetical protein
MVCGQWKQLGRHQESCRSESKAQRRHGGKAEKIETEGGAVWQKRAGLWM